MFRGSGDKDSWFHLGFRKLGPRVEVLSSGLRRRTVQLGPSSDQLNLIVVTLGKYTF